MLLTALTALSPVPVHLVQNAKDWVRPAGCPAIVFTSSPSAPHSSPHAPCSSSRRSTATIPVPLSRFSARSPPLLRPSPVSLPTPCIYLTCSSPLSSPLLSSSLIKSLPLAPPSTRLTPVALSPSRGTTSQSSFNTATFSVSLHCPLFNPLVSPSCFRHPPPATLFPLPARPLSCGVSTEFRPARPHCLHSWDN